MDSQPQIAPDCPRQPQIAPDSFDCPKEAGFQRFRSLARDVRRNGPGRLVFRGFGAWPEMHTEMVPGRQFRGFGAWPEMYAEMVPGGRFSKFSEPGPRCTQKWSQEAGFQRFRNLARDVRRNGPRMLIFRGFGAWPEIHTEIIPGG